MTNVSTSSAVVFRVKMTTAQVVETSVTNNSLSKDYPHPDDHDKQITVTPGFKPFTNIRFHGRSQKSEMNRRGELSQARKTNVNTWFYFLLKCWNTIGVLTVVPTVRQKKKKAHEIFHSLWASHSNFFSDTIRTSTILLQSLNVARHISKVALAWIHSRASVRSSHGPLSGVVSVYSRY